MRKLSIDNESLEIQLEKMKKASALERFYSLKKKDLPQVVYTSFDGDHLSYGEVMKRYALRQGLVPLNPESALGTYLVTNHYQGSKLPIIIDCFSLLMRCDYFWVVTDLALGKNEFSISSLPEGVIAETLFWLRHRKKSATIVDLHQGTSVKKLNGWRGLKKSLHPEQIEGIEQTLNIPLSKLRKVAYLTAGEDHVKHADWMRKLAYNYNRVPMCPYTLVSLSSLKFILGTGFYVRILVNTSFAIKADEFWIFGSRDEKDFSVDSLQDDVLAELLLTKKFKPNTKVYYISFAQAEVPKYKKTSLWALTKLEKLNNNF